MKTTIGEFVDAIEKNGLPQFIGALFARDLDPGHDMHIDEIKQYKIGAACAVGQGYINIGATDLKAKEIDAYKWDTVQTTIVRLNDQQRMSISGIVREIRKLYPHFMDTPLRGKKFDYMKHIDKSVYHPKEVTHE